MKIKKNHIVIIVVIIIMFAIYSLLRYAYRQYYKDSYLLIDQPLYGKNKKDINTNMKTTVCNKGITWSFSSWIYVNDWKYRFGEKKYIIQSDNVNMWLGEKEPHLHISTNLFNNAKDKAIVFKNLPLQKWFNIVIILDNRNLDLFINNELYRSIYFDQVPEQKKVTNLTIFPNGGLSGYISQFRYYSYNLSRSRINIDYDLGFRGLWYKYFILRMIYKTYLFFYNMIYGNNDEIDDTIKTCP
jgi:hypothetical protein